MFRVLFGLVIQARAVCELLILKSSVFLKCTFGVFEFKVKFKVLKCGRRDSTVDNYQRLYNDR